jgi:hypothetical protein
MGNISNITVFEKCFSLLSLKSFRCPFSDTYAKKLLSGSAILLFIDAHLRQLDSLEDIAENLEAEDQLKDYLQIKAVNPSTLYRKLSKLPTDLLQRMTLQLLEEISSIHMPAFQSGNIGTLDIMDSTEVSLPCKAGKWAYVSESKNAIKVHVLYRYVNEKTAFPQAFLPTTAAVSDQEMAPYLVTDKETTYVMDRGVSRDLPKKMGH